MIEINLVRQLPMGTTFDKTSSQDYGWIIVVVFCLGLGVASWGWTQVKHQELQNLLQEKTVQAQSFTMMHTTLNRLEQSQKEQQRLSTSIEEIQEMVIGKKQPMTVLHGVSQSLAGLNLWLDSVQMIDRVVELRGQSLAFQEIGKYLDALEHAHVIVALPVVEILDQEGQGQGKVFSFTIRFALGTEVVA